MPEQEEEFQAPLYAFHLAYKPRNIATIFVTEDMMLAIMAFRDQFTEEPDAVALIGQVDYIGRYDDDEPEGAVVLN
ncbi:MAG: hypothetical protein ACYCY2_03340 [Acidithiobacillus ferriphilus]